MENDIKPYMSKIEIDKLVEHIKLLPKNSVIIEWGSGGTTIELLKNLRKDQSMISIEHNKTWFDLVSNKTKLFKNHTYFHKPETNLIREMGGTGEENPAGLKDYILPDETILNANMFIIDGLARVTIALMLLAKAKKDSVIFIHDYVGREQYYDLLPKLFKIEKLEDSHIGNQKTLTKLYIK